MHVLYLLATLIYVCGAQGIIGFTVGIGETNCVLKKAIREGDIIVFKATLAKTSNDSDWFLFFVSAVTKNKASTPKVLKLSVWYKAYISSYCLTGTKLISGHAVCLVQNLYQLMLSV
ncbi:hypothetical protein BgiBS90_029768 [Biomphalaria glabrata]|nr:hypothetical protein BgiBS90_029768 [Biomphalaria glabrata]